MKKGIEYLQSQEKEALDKFGAFMIIAASLPVGILGGVVSALDTRSNPIFSQERLGGVGPKFMAYKFRTIGKLAAEQTDLQVFGTFDPRSTKTGQFLRQTGFDEWPQLLNVFGGQMSLVGPRPLIEKEIEQYLRADSALFDEWYDAYQQVKPGLLGESQVYRHHYVGISDQLRTASMRMDLDYIESARLSTDIRIIASTPKDLFAANWGVEPVETVSY